MVDSVSDWAGRMQALWIGGHRIEVASVWVIQFLAKEGQHSGFYGGPGENGVAATSNSIEELFPFENEAAPVAAYEEPAPA